MKILLVDDEPDILDILKAHLSSLDYEILTALEPSQALALLESHNPDVVFLDFSLPQMDGLTLLKLIKRLVPSTIVVMVSGRASTDAARECLEHGAFDYIQKPFNLNRINDVLRAIALMQPD